MQREYQINQRSEGRREKTCEREGLRERMVSAQDHHLDPLSSSLTNILFTAVELSKYTVPHTRQFRRAGYRGEATYDGDRRVLPCTVSIGYFLQP